MPPLTALPSGNGVVETVAITAIVPFSASLFVQPKPEASAGNVTVLKEPLV